MAGPWVPALLQQAKDVGPWAGAQPVAGAGKAALSPALAMT